LTTTIPLKDLEYMTNSNSLSNWEYQGIEVLALVLVAATWTPNI